MISHYMSKNIILNSHQIKPVEFMKNNHGLILYHSTGSGKTITSLIAMYQFKKDIIIIGPKSARKAFIDEINKLKYDMNKFKLFSYKKIKILTIEDSEILKDKCVIVDEAHNLRNENMNNLVLISALSQCYKIMLLTATPVINYLNDLSVLVNIVKKKEVLPTEKNVFEFLFINNYSLEIENEHILIDKIKNSISYYENINDDNYPKYEIIKKEIEMNNEQLNQYVNYVREIIYDKKIDKKNKIFDIDFSTLHGKKKNAFLSATRQLSNTIDGSSDFPKIKEIFNIIKKGPYPVIVYSNYLKNGIMPLMKLLLAYNITFKSITGGTNNDKITKIVNDYNAHQIQVLLLSSAGSESLDLKNTRQIHVMEPHWNEPRIKQVIGRAIRYKSHQQLNKKDRHVIIYKWICTFPENILSKTADEYLYELSNKKMEIFDKFKKIIVKMSIENNKKKYLQQKNE
jgi:superfamily II DNA or RNA helicase